VRWAAEPSSRRRGAVAERVKQSKARGIKDSG
jgi:hypothetical protein